MAEVKTTKKITKVTAKPVKKVATKKESAPTVAVVEGKKTNKGLLVDVFDTAGKVAENITLPASVFDTKVNDVLMAQAVRIYLANQRRGTASTKTRGEVEGSTRKIYRQKGTGRARHGGIRAPIFVKGGIAHGPQPRDYTLHLPTQMKRAAIKSALTTQFKAGSVAVVTGFEKIETKTKLMVQALQAVTKNKKILFVMPKDMKVVFKSARNIAGVNVTTANRVNTYDILNAKTIVVMKDAIEVLEKTFHKEK